MTEVTVTGEQVHAFMGLFRGYPNRFGRFVVTGVDETKGKTKGTVNTEYRPPNESDFRRHLEGRERVGIVPLREDNTVSFSALDIDIYNGDVTIADFSKRIMKLPLICTSSKSGGIHVWMFTDPPAPAADIIKVMKHWAGELGHSRCEVFPKQSGRANKDDVGNWINLPYFGNTCKAVLWNNDGTEMRTLELDEFLKVAKNTNPDLNYITEGALKVTSRDKGASAHDFNDGPPCLQTILRNFSSGELDLSGTRNIALFNIATYLKRKHDGPKARSIVANINTGGYTLTIDHSRTKKAAEDATEVINVPAFGLPEDELKKTVLRQTEKEYGYQCSQFPLSEFCQKTVCKKRKYGVGSDNRGDFDVSIENFVQYNTNPPQYFCDVGGKRVIIKTSDDLMNFKKFQARVLDYTTIHVPDLTAKQWNDFLHKHLEHIEVIEPPYEGSDVVAALFSYVNERKAKTIEDMAKDKKAYKNVKLGFYEFMPDGFRRWATSEGLIKNFDSRVVREELEKELDLKVSTDVTKRVGKNYIRVWRVPIEAIEKQERAEIEIAEESPF
jgi:hypothetical protein